MFGYESSIAGKSAVGQRFDRKISFWSPAMFMFGTLFFLPIFVVDSFTQVFPIRSGCILVAATAIAFFSIAVSGWVSLSFRSCVVNKKTKHTLHEGILWSKRILIVSAPMIVAALVYTYSDLTQIFGGNINIFLVPSMILLIAISVFLAPRQLRHDKKLLKLIEELYSE
jgi:hypothetical protein